MDVRVGPHRGAGPAAHILILDPTGATAALVKDNNACPRWSESAALQNMPRIARHARYGGVIMRIVLVGGLALALLVAPNVVRAESAIVRSGVKSQIAFHMALSSRTCQGYHIVITILTAPRNGTLTAEPKNRVIPPVTSRGGAQLPQCIGKTATGLAIFYRSKPGFVGQDSLKYRRSSPDDPRDPSAGDISYTVTVK